MRQLEGRTRREPSGERRDHRNRIVKQHEPRMGAMAEVNRDRSTKFSWGELSSLTAYLRQEVEAVRAGAGRGFDEALAKIREPLERLANHGGDPRFALVELVSARWRRVRSPGRDIPRWIRLLERVAAEEELLKLVGSAVASQLKRAIDQSLEFLKSFSWQDQGVFDSRGTRWQHADRRRESAHVTMAAALLDWHLRKGTTGRWHRRGLLAELLDGVGLLQYRRGGDAVEQVNRRLGRIEDDYYRKFAIPMARVAFHDIHRFLAITLNDGALTRCGSACPEFDDPDDPLSKGKLLMGPHELRITDGQASGGKATQEASGDPPTIEVRITILDEKPPETGSTQPSQRDDQPDSPTT